MNKLKQLWNRLHSSLWFLPSLIVAGSALMAVALIELDSSVEDKLLYRWPRIFGAGAAGARGMLSTIAGSMMSVVGVTFSMTLVALALASSQYTSRVLRNFMGSRVTQGVLGMFAGIFVYCLIVLRTIRGGDEGKFVPSMAVSFAVLLALVGVGVLIFFIHHIASSIQASSIIASVANETMTTVERLFPEKIGHGPGECDEGETLPDLAGKKWQPVMASSDGYIDSVDNGVFLRVARAQKTLVRMERGVGEFVVRNTPLVSLALAGPLESATVSALQSAFSLSRYRTVNQDAAFGIRQIVDVALKALSPGINDTTTAVTCVNYLTAILARLAARQIPSAYRYEDAELRTITIGPTFASLVAISFNQIRVSAKGNVAVISRMIDSLETLAGLTLSARRQRTLREQLDALAELAERTIEAASDREATATQVERARKAMNAENKGDETNPIAPG